jgi:hypothetical protein
MTGNVTSIAGTSTSYRNSGFSIRTIRFCTSDNSGYRYPWEDAGAMGAKENDAEPSQILEHVFLGSRTHARDMELLQRLRITHILNVRRLVWAAGAMAS